MLRGIVGEQTPLLLMVREAQLGAASELKVGANESFILAPCNSAELRVRVAAFKEFAPSRELSGDFRCGKYRFQAVGRRVSFNGKTIKLQPLEFELALHLFRNPGYVHPREMLFKTLWRHVRSDPDTRTIDVHIASLRRKLAIGLPNACELLSVRNVGYRLNIYFTGQEDDLPLGERGSSHVDDQDARETHRSAD
jgi:DNA-binding response OmpR family regulator